MKQFDQDQVVIGHKAEVNLDLPSDQISPIHCMIELRDNGYYVCDLGSQTGTFKNGQAVLDETIASGDELTVGPYKIVFYVGVPKPKVSPVGEISAAAPEKKPLSEVPPAAVETPKAPVAPVAEAAPVAEKKAKPPKESPKINESAAIIPAAASLDSGGSASAAKSSGETPAKPQLRSGGKAGVDSKKNKKTFAPPSEIKDLRDYLTPGKGTTVEVIVAWKERVIATYHFRQKGVVRLGEGSKSQIHMPPGFAPANWALIDISNGVRVNTTGDMQVEMVQNNQIVNLDSLAKSGKAQRSGQNAVVRLDQNEMICISSVGSSLTVYIRFVPSTPLVPLLPMFLSGSEITGVIMSLVMVAVLFLYISATTPKDLEEQKQEDVQRVAQVIFNMPPKPEAKPTPTPTPVATPTPPPPKPPEPKKAVVADEKKETQQKGPSQTKQVAQKASQAAKASEVAPKENQNRPKKFTSTRQGGAVKMGETAGANAQSANKDVSKIGLFSALGTGGNRAKLDQAYSGTGEVLGMADKATGTSGQNENRAGDDLGSKFKDTGAGGKGTATQGIAGIGTKGRGSGQGAYGASDGFGAKSSVAIEAGGNEEDFAGTIDREAVRRVIRSKLHEVKACYERVLNTLPKGQQLEGKVTIKWKIVAKGYAKEVSVDKSKTTLGSNAVETCIRDRLSSWIFPEPPEGMVAEVSYPFVLNQSN